MSNELMTKPVEFEVNGESVKLSGTMVKEYLVRGNDQVTEQEIVMFINLCKYQKLNPFLNEAYLVKFKGAPAQIITSKEAFMKRAEANEHYSGMEAGIIVERNGEMVDIEGAIKLPNDQLIGGWANIFRDDRILPIKVRISLEEFSKGQSTWNKMPLNMIRKTAIVNAMREAFPGVLENMYTEEESVDSPDGTVQRINHEVKQNANKQIIDIQVEEEPKGPQNKPPERGQKQQQQEPQHQEQMTFTGTDGPGF